jgi:FG-GAP repeat
MFAFCVLLFLPLFPTFATVNGLGVSSFQEIGSGKGGFTAALRSGDNFGVALSPLLDLDNDGVPDFAVGAPGDDDGGVDRGAVYVLFMNHNGTVDRSGKISDTRGGFGGLANGEKFGRSVAGLGDLDGDNVTDVAVGAPFSCAPGCVERYGAVYILFMNQNGTVKAKQKIDTVEGGFKAALRQFDNFGFALATLDVNGDGRAELAVGTPGDKDGPRPAVGAVYILFLHANGTVSAEQKIGLNSGGFAGLLEQGDQFGVSVTSIGDLDSDGVPDLAVGAIGDDDGCDSCGAVYIVMLNSDGTVKDTKKIGRTQGGLSFSWESVQFGRGLAASDFDGDSVTDLVVGAPLDDDGGKDRGALFVLGLNSDGSVLADNKISSIYSGFTAGLQNNSIFGDSVTFADLDGDGVSELAVGAHSEFSAPLGPGTVYVLFLNASADPGVLTTTNIPGATGPTSSHMIPGSPEVQETSSEKAWFEIEVVWWIVGAVLSCAGILVAIGIAICQRRNGSK